MPADVDRAWRPSILYVFRLMECEIFYSRNPSALLFGGYALSDGGASDPDYGGSRCNRPEINAGTAAQYSILGMSTSLSGVFNLFVCGYFIKLWGPRWAFVSQTSLLGLRVCTQILGVTIGGRPGELVFQVCQAIGVVGGPRGFQVRSFRIVTPTALFPGHAPCQIRVNANHCLP